MAASTKPAAPRLYRREGAPVFWALADGPRRTFASDAGDVADLMAGSPSGTRAAGVSWGSGPLGGCLVFPGTAAVSVPGTAALTTFSFAAWVTLTVFSGSPSQFLLCRGTASNRNYALDARSGGFNAGFTVGGVFKEVLGGSGVVAGPLYHAAGTYDGATLKVYVNGTLANTLAASGTPDATGPLSLGAIGASTVPMNGSLHDVRVWARALPAAEIAREYSDPYWRLRPPATRRVVLMPTAADNPAAFLLAF